MVVLAYCEHARIAGVEAEALTMLSRARSDAAEWKCAAALLYPQW